MWDLPRPGIELVSPALVGGFSITGPPGKSHNIWSLLLLWYLVRYVSLELSQSLLYRLLQFLEVNLGCPGPTDRTGRQVPCHQPHCPSSLSALPPPWCPSCIRRDFLLITKLAKSAHILSFCISINDTKSDFYSGSLCIPVYFLEQKKIGSDITRVLQVLMTPEPQSFLWYNQGNGCSWQMVWQILLMWTESPLLYNLLLSAVLRGAIWQSHFKVPWYFSATHDKAKKSDFCIF